MKKIKNSIFFKIIFSILIIIIISTTFAPIYSNAAIFDDEDSTFGGQLFKPISKLICGISDGVIKSLQKTFLGYGEISDGIETSEVEIKTYKILYGPETIFSNKVPALNADFMSPSKEKYKIKVDRKQEPTEVTSSQEGCSTGGDGATISRNLAIDALGSNTYGYDINTITEIDVNNDKVKGLFAAAGLGLENAKAYTWEYSGETYYSIETTTISAPVSLTDEPHYLHTIKIYKDNVATEEGKEIEYSASILQPIISKWFKGLRLIAMVGLMSVLVYIGIRIIIASTGQEKAKYKKMIGDWLAAMCILFILQYLMSFIITITDELINVFSGIGQISIDGEDVLMTQLRNTVATGNGKFFNVFAETIMYVALVTLTAVFTFHYLKRLIYLAFLTMIAPLISLTYPLDKIKDGQAQAFTLWIREYTFNTLIPVIHLLIYTIFVSTASTLVETNPIYAIVCIAFIIPAEKFIRKMFGFDKATTVSPLGAAAGGALIMNAINKIGRTNIEQKAKNDNKPVRTTGLGGGNTWSPTLPVSTPGDGGSGGNSPTDEKPSVYNTPDYSFNDENSSTYTAPTYSYNYGYDSTNNFNAGEYGFDGNYDDGSTYSSSESDNEQLGSESNNDMLEPDTNQNPLDTQQSISGQNINMDVKPSSGISVGAGLKEAFFERFNRKNIKGYVKNKGKKGARFIGKAALGATLGTFALGVGVSTGDLKNSASYALAGAAAGGKLGDRISTRVMNEGTRTGSAFKKGALGGDEYNAKKIIAEARDDREFINACRAAGITKKDEQELLIRQFIGNGITEKDDIVKAVVARKNYEKSQGITRKKEKDGSLIITQKDKDGSVSTTTQRIDIQGNKVEETTKRSKDGSSITTMETTLPNNNRVERTIQRDRNGRIIDDVITTIQTREENGQVIEETESRDRNGNLTQRKARVKRAGVSNRELIGVAKYEHSVSDSAWGTPRYRTNSLDRLYNQTGDADAVRRVELLVNYMKG